jgi:competence protein ComEC
LNSKALKIPWDNLKKWFYGDRDSHVLWLPVIFALGAVLGFSSCVGLVIPMIMFLAATAIVFARKSSLLRTISLVVAFLSLGFLRARGRIASHNFPMIRYNIGRVLIHGFLEEEMINFSASGKQIKYIILAVDRIEAINKNGAFANDRNFETPKKVRIKLLNPEDKVIAGPSIVEANLVPIEGKKFSSDFDLQMYFYFKKIGSMGYNGVLRSQSGDGSRISRGAKIRLKISKLRTKIALRLIAVRRGPATGLIAAILTGYRGLMNKNLLKLINNLGLATILSISSAHMLFLSQMILFMVKEILFRFRKTAQETNIYKISAVISLLVNSLYLLVAGFSISTVRAYIINTVNLLGVILGRFNSPIRSLMFAMFLMIFSRPELLFRVGLYMSFISSLVMIAFVDYYYIYWEGDEPHSRTSFFKNIKISFIISFLIEMAVAPLEIYSFNTFGFYKVIAVLILSPFISFIVIPMGLLSLALFPLGLESILIYPLSYLVDALVFVLKFLGKISGSIVYVRSPPVISVITMIFGILWMSLWTKNWRKLGFTLYLFGVFSIVFGRTPDVIIANSEKIAIFFDEKNRAYAYGTNGRQILRILRKFGKNDYENLTKVKMDSCAKLETPRCSRLQITPDSIEFYKNGHNLKLTKGKYFRPSEGAANFTIVTLKNPRYNQLWFNRCDRRQRSSPSIR